MKLRNVALVALMGAAAPALAFAQQPQGPYVSAGAGISLPFSADVVGIGPDDDLNIDNGLAIAGAFGYAYPTNWRTEVEYSFREGDAESLDVVGALEDGATTVHALMANLIYDIPMFQQSSGFAGDLKPRLYVGAGLGAAYTKHRFFNAQPRTVFVNDSEFNFAYQAIGGVAFPVDDDGKYELDLGYRYLKARKSEYETIIPFGSADANFGGHTFLASLRYNFGQRAAAPEPVAPPPPPPAPVQQTMTPDPLDFVVYFELDKANLSSNAQDIIAQAADEALGHEISSVKVEGHTDTSGTSAHNQELSERRAANVRGALESQGVPGSLINVDAYGESRPATTTGDGVREPLNRRSEVTIEYAAEPATE